MLFKTLVQKLAMWLDSLIDAHLERLSKSLDEAVAMEEIVDELASMETAERSEIIQELTEREDVDL